MANYYKSEFDATFVLATITIVACVILLLAGIDSDVKAIIGTVLGFYFGLQVPSTTNKYKQNGNSSTP